MYPVYFFNPNFRTLFIIKLFHLILNYSHNCSQIFETLKPQIYGLQFLNMHVEIQHIDNVRYKSTLSNINEKYIICMFELFFLQDSGFTK